MSVTLPAVLRRSHDMVGPALADAIAGLSDEVRPVVGYHAGILDAQGRPSDAGGGKALRPSLTLLACEAAGGRPSWAIPGAVAVQLVHDFSLLHDDVMDDDVERRHRPTAWTVFGVGRAILAGDALLARAMQLLLDHPSPARVRASELLATATAELITGQGEDLAFETREHVTVADCLRMSAHKTGALLAAAAAIGAVLAEADTAVVDAFEAYGAHLGLAFQAVDDLLGIWGRPEATGKSAFSDLQRRKKSLPVVAALEAAGPVAEELAELLQRPTLDRGELRRAAQLVEANGGREVTDGEARRQLQLALDALAGIDLVASAQDELTDVARFIVDREL